MQTTRLALAAALMIAFALTLAACNPAEQAEPGAEPDVITDTLAADTGPENADAPDTDAATQPESGEGGEAAGLVDEELATPQGPVGLDVPPPWDLDPAAVSIDVQGLPYDWEAVLVPEIGYDASQPTEPSGLPEHVEIRLSDTGSAAAGTANAIVYIIPVNEYLAMWNDAGDNTVAERIARIQEIAYQLPSPPLNSDLPVLPVEAVTGANDLAVRVGRASTTEDSASKDGFRFIGRFSDDQGPVTNEDLRYVYQGFTNDGKHLVAGFFPINAPTLPANLAALGDDDLQSFEVDPDAGIAAAAEELTGVAADDWQPSRDALGDVIASLRIDGMAVNGLVGPSWEWTGVTFLDDDRPVENPADYVIRYDPSGEVFMDSHCRTVSTTYEVDGGLLGTVQAVLAKVGPPVECDDDRLPEFEATGLIGANYFVEAGGQTMGVQLPGEGPIHWFRLAE